MARRREREAPDMAAMVERIARGMVRRAADGDLEVLSALRTMRAAIDTACIDAARELNDFDGGRYSWAEIGAQLGITRQAAFQAFARRKPTVDDTDRYEGLF
ncbi:hypothetical protein [Nocardioides alcanivorans]|uniref:hypothetical protein n=1 Tax=Nocardioides alcanivorans TaxID=2897352 RepID=UPI001F384F66|nr:hypothetical protein [Nocardioides alcanivorans]